MQPSQVNTCPFLKPTDFKAIIEDNDQAALAEQNAANAKYRSDCQKRCSAVISKIDDMFQAMHIQKKDLIVSAARDNEILCKDDFCSKELTDSLRAKGWRVQATLNQEYRVDARAETISMPLSNPDMRMLSRWCG